MSRIVLFSWQPVLFQHVCNYIVAHRCFSDLYCRRDELVDPPVARIMSALLRVHRRSSFVFRCVCVCVCLAIDAALLLWQLVE